MDWKDLRSAYFESISRLGAKGWKRAAEGFDELEKEVKNRFPEGHDKPLGLVDGGGAINRRFYDVEQRKLLVSRKCIDAFERAKKVLQPFHRRELGDFYEGTDRAKSVSVRLANFFDQWLVANGWQLTMEKSPGIGYPFSEAEKGKIKVKVWAVPPYVYVSGFSRVYLESACRNKIRDQMMRMVEEKIANPEITPVLLFAGDDDTMNAALPYLPFLKKLEIRIFIVTGAEDVEEL